ncbi:MAG: EAL domain-containing protein [gamma proteobacterium symbiont of Taylorina sp.]|nr:EAL domain-containing protein [gamma proteobacterium symbiont of Taylorina sp.]
MTKIINRQFIILLTLILLVGIASIVVVAHITDKNMRLQLLKQARITASTINIERINSLSASKKDINQPDYERIKSQLAQVRKTNKQFQFIYLMGQHLDKRIFFFVDSQPVDSKDYAPPGLIYEEVSDSYLHIFDTKKEAVVGPITDRWGTLVTALIPIKNPVTGDFIAILGMDITANNWNKKILFYGTIPFVLMLLIIISTLLIALKRQVAQAHFESEEKHRLFFENSPIGIIHYDNNGTITDVNDAIISILGSSRNKLIGFNLDEIQNKVLANEVSKSLDGITGHYEGEYKSITGNKTSIIKVDLVPILHNGKVSACIGIAEDITKRKKTEQKLAETNYNLQQYLDVIDDINIGLFVVDENFYIRYMNNSMIEWFGDHTGKICYSSVAKLEQPCSYCKLREVIIENKKVIYEPETPDGKFFEIVATSIKNSDGATCKMEVIRNVTDKKNAQKYLLEQKEKLEHQAHHDALTELPNRLLFNDRLVQSIEKSKRNNSKMALLFIDLDHFKEINDSMGHNIGDEVLKIITQRLNKIIRKEDTLARLGGDEFTVIVEDLKQGQDASLLAQKIIEFLAEPIKIENNSLYVSSSIGISLYPSDGDCSQNLLKYADSAMYKAKDEGRNNFQFYSAEMTELAIERVVMESSFRSALINQEFIVYYQPQINAEESKLIGLEALVRWQHSTMGLVSPAKFIPLAESTGLIIELDQFVMKTAMKQVVKWHAQGLNPGKLALNLAIKQLQQKDFINILKNMITETQCKPEWLELEVTEGQIMTNPEAAVKILNLISDIGIDLAVDDFGTGYSSLSYLKKLPINKLKIDQSFVRELPDDEEDVAIAKAVITLAKNLNLRIIAEGVETTEQKEFLVQNGCTNIQGYLYSRPIPANEMEEYLKKI